MKPVVSSLVALALAIAPLAAWASPTESAAKDTKPVAAKVVKHASKKHHKTADAKQIAKADKSDKAEKVDSEKPAVQQVKHNAGKKHGKLQQVHHAHGVDVSGPGHKEPKDHGALVPASMKTPVHKPAAAKEPSKKAELPALPSPNAGKPSKGGAEKGGKKAAPKAAPKSDDAKNDGEPARDEDFAELVARIRGLTPAKAVEPKPEVEPRGKGKQAKAGKPEKACAKDPTEIIRGPEVERVVLTTCEGKLAPLAVEQLSVLVRPGGAARPTASFADLAKNAKKNGAEIAPGIRRVEDRLVLNLAHVVEHFAKQGTIPKVSIVSGYRPTSVGSMHQTGRAIDFRLEGVKNEDVVAYCKTLQDTGCGYYPNSSFVHLDVRDAGAGHVTWIDASGPGETPRYVASWPPPEPAKTAHGKRDGLESTSARTTEEAPEAVDEHPATPKSHDEKKEETEKSEKDSRSEKSESSRSSEPAGGSEKTALYSTFE